MQREEEQSTGMPATLGPFQLMLLGVGGTIGTGIFVLTSEAAQKAGPSMLISFVLAGAVCGVSALCYAEMAAMIPRAGSAYTYVKVALGEVPAWMVGWALLLEYAVTAAAVAVGWSGYLSGQLQSTFHVQLPAPLRGGPFAGGILNLPAVLLSISVTVLLNLGTRESARVNTALVLVKLSALIAFASLTLPNLRAGNFVPLAPLGWMSHGGAGTLGAAASIFFAYVGFDAVSTAAEETRDPQRNVPLGLLAGLAVCTLVYMLIAAGVIGSPLGAQPVFALNGNWFAPGSAGMMARCAALARQSLPLPCSTDGLAYVLRTIGHTRAATYVGVAAFLALPSVVLVLIYGQTRMLFAMARDGLLPSGLATVHSKRKTPMRMTTLTGLGVALAAAFFPIGKLADIANSGTLFAFSLVAISTLWLRRASPDLVRPFRVPFLPVVASCTLLGCVGLFFSLPFEAMMVLPIWTAAGLFLYLVFKARRQHLQKTR